VDLFTSLLIGYVVVITVFLSIALTLQFTGHRGKFSRALLISAAVGIVIPLAIYFSYPYLFPLPVAPPPTPIDPNAPLLPQFFASIAQGLPALGQAIGYGLGRIIDPFCYGVLAVVIVFPLSFLIPCRSPDKIVRDPSTSSG
jgi:hypothetical protein